MREPDILPSHSAAQPCVVSVLPKAPASRQDELPGSSLLAYVSVTYLALQQTGILEMVIKQLRTGSGPILCVLRREVAGDRSRVRSH